MSLSKINIIWILTNLLFIFVGYIFIDDSKLYFILSIIGAIQLLVSIMLYRKQGEKLFSPIIIYIIVMYLFLFGQCLMWLLTENYDGRNLIAIYDKSIIVKAQIFTLFSFFFFHLSCFNSKAKKNETGKLSLTNDTIYNSIKIVGVILLLISIIPEIVFNLRLFFIAYSQGYLGIYNNGASGLFLKFLNLREFFFPSFILIYVADSKLNKFKKLKKLLLGIILLDVLVGFYVGSRADALMQCLSLLLLFETLSKKKLNFKIYLKYGILFIMLLSITNVVRNIRTESNKTISSFVDAFFEKDNNGLIVSTIGEMGGSMATCMETMSLVPKYYSYKYGTSYLYSFAWFLPSSISKASMNNWIDTVRYTGSGWGFSTTAEAYFNFGNYGVLMFLIFGFFAGKFFKGLNSELFEKRPISFALSFILFSRLLVFSRIDFLSTIPSIVYFYLLIKLFVVFIYYYLNRERG